MLSTRSSLRVLNFTSVMELNVRKYFTKTSTFILVVSILIGFLGASACLSNPTKPKTNHVMVEEPTDTKKAEIDARITLKFHELREAPQGVALQFEFAIEQLHIPEHQYAKKVIERKCLENNHLLLTGLRQDNQGRTFYAMKVIRQEIDVVANLPKTY
jgi:hypothetical protein